jgi:hypothetical protein
MVKQTTAEPGNAQNNLILIRKQEVLKTCSDGKSAGKIKSNRSAPCFGQVVFDGNTTHPFFTMSSRKYKLFVTKSDGSGRTHALLSDSA